MNTQWTSTDDSGHTLTAGLDAAGNLHILRLNEDGGIAASLHLPKTTPAAPTDTAADVMLAELHAVGLL